MPIFDYARSFLTFTVPGRSNTARIQLDARCVLTDHQDGTIGEFFLITPCKSERMYFQEGLFQDPNYDFCGVWSQEEYLILRTYPTHDPERLAEWEPGENASRFAEVKIDIRTFPAAQALATDDRIVQAALKNLALVARTHIHRDNPPLSAVLEYPVKTINVCEDTGRFQVDTGPVLLPDFASDKNRPVERLSLAFVCYNTFDSAEFVLRQPTPVIVEGSEVCKVMHYSRIVRMPAQHELFCAGEIQPDGGT